MNATMTATRLRRGAAIAAVCLALLGLAGSAEAQPGTVTGRLTSAATGTPVSGALVFLCARGTCAQVTTNGTGTYTVTLTAGTYFGYTEAAGFAGQIIGGVSCPFFCTDTAATALGAPIAVVAGATLTRDVALSPAGSVTGIVSDAATAAPIANAVVTLVQKFNGRVEGVKAMSNGAGVFTFGGLGAGAYAALAGDLGPPPHVSEIFGDIPCVGACSLDAAAASGAPIVVSPGAVTPGVNIALEPGASLSGTVRRQGTGTGIAGVRVVASMRVGSELVEAAGAVTSATGTYVLSGLPAGGYVVHTDSAGFIDQVHNGARCRARCEPAEVATGAPVLVPARGSVGGIDLTLSPGGSVTGRISEAGTNASLAASVSAYLVNGSELVPAGVVNANSSGVFTIPGLATGSYVVLALALDFVPEYFGGTQTAIPGPEDLPGVTRIGVVDGSTTANINVVLDRSAKIRGRVRMATTLAAVTGQPVALFRGGPAPRAVLSAATDANGNYTLSGFPQGPYYVATQAAQLNNQAWNGFPCPGGVCTPAFVTSNSFEIPTANGATYANTDFTLGTATGPPGSPRGLALTNTPGGVEFSWRPPTQGGSATSYVLEAGLAPGTTFASVPLAVTSLVVPGIPPGTYFIRVKAVNAAGQGPATEDRTLIVGGGGVAAPYAPSTIVPLVIDGRLTLTWLPVDAPPAATSYRLEVGTAAGRSDVGVLSVTGHLFQFTGVPPGVYFVRLRAVAGLVVGPPSADVMLVVGNVPAPPSEPTFLRAAAAGNVVTLTWGAPLFGPVTDYVIEAGTRPDAADIGVVRTGSSATSLPVPGVPPGRYFLRVRAVNAQGVGAQSPELELVVP